MLWLSMALAVFVRLYMRVLDVYGAMISDFSPLLYMHAVVVYGISSLCPAVHVMSTFSQSEG